MRIIGVDPGLRCLGWGVIHSDGTRIAHIANGLCRSGEGSLSLRLVRLARGLREAIAMYAPQAAAIEQTFVNRDGAATLKLGQARGVALLTLAEAGLAIGEYAPNTIKKSVVGAGHADKAQIAYMLGILLSGARPAGPDAADALAVAICHAHHGSGARAALRVQA